MEGVKSTRPLERGGGKNDDEAESPNPAAWSTSAHKNRLI